MKWQGHMALRKKEWSGRADLNDALHLDIVLYNNYLARSTSKYSSIFEMPRRCSTISVFMYFIVVLRSEWPRSVLAVASETFDEIRVETVWRSLWKIISLTPDNSLILATDFRTTLGSLHLRGKTKSSSLLCFVIIPMAIELRHMYIVA